MQKCEAAYNRMLAAKYITVILSYYLTVQLWLFTNPRLPNHGGEQNYVKNLACL